MNLIDPKILAERMNVKTVTVYKWVESNKITCTKHGGRIYFTEKDISEFLEKRKRKARYFVKQ